MLLGVSIFMNWLQKVSQNETFTDWLFPEQKQANDLQTIEQAIVNGVIPEKIYHGTTANLKGDMLTPQLPSNLGGSVHPLEPAKGIYFTFNNTFAQQAAQNADPQNPVILALSTMESLDYMSPNSLKALLGVAIGQNQLSPQNEFVMDKSIPLYILRSNQ